MYRQGNVLRIDNYKINDTAQICREIASTTEEGLCTGMIYALYENGRSIRAGVTGEYRKNPSEICRVARALLARYEQKADQNYRNICATIAIFFLCLGLGIVSIGEASATVYVPSPIKKIKKSLPEAKKPAWFFSENF